METQNIMTHFDHSVRVLSLANLAAMCERISGTAHTYRIERVTTNRVHVSYSNPDEYGNPDPRTAILPAWPSGFDGKENPSVALEILSVVGEREGDDDDFLRPLFDCEPLFRKRIDGQDVWETEFEIVSEQLGFKLVSRWHQGCFQFWHVEDKAGTNLHTLFPGDVGSDVHGEYRDYRKAQSAVVEYSRRGRDWLLAAPPARV